MHKVKIELVMYISLKYLLFQLLQNKCWQVLYMILIISVKYSQHLTQLNPKFYIFNPINLKNNIAHCVKFSEKL